MEKYGVSKEQVDALIKGGICDSEESAREKVASGLAGALLRELEERLKRAKKREPSDPNIDG